MSWKPFGTAEFDHGTAVLRTAGGVLRQGYRDAAGGKLIAFAGYAPPGISDPIARPRAQAVATALAPEATLIDPANVDLVTNPPPDTMPPGTDASVFLVSYEQPKSGDCVDVVMLRSFTDEGKELFDALVNSDPGRLDKLKQFLMPLADVSWTEGKVDEKQLQAMLDAYEKYREKQADDGTPVHAVALYAWIAEDWAKQQHEDEAKKHVDFLAEQLHIPLRQVMIVDLEHKDRCPVLLVIVLEQG